MVNSNIDIVNCKYREYLIGELNSALRIKNCLCTPETARESRFRTGLIIIVGV